jgi:7-alpha-hydroxysteroid dehydrogenase
MSASLMSALKEHGDYREDIEDHTPLGRIAAASELTEAVQYLASDAASFMTGHIMTVDGGRTLIDPATSPAH